MAELSTCFLHGWAHTHTHLSLATDDHDASMASRLPNIGTSLIWHMIQGSSATAGDWLHAPLHHLCLMLKRGTSHLTLCYMLRASSHEIWDEGFTENLVTVKLRQWSGCLDLCCRCAAVRLETELCQEALMKGFLKDCITAVQKRLQEDCRKCLTSPTCTVQRQDEGPRAQEKCG